MNLWKQEPALKGIPSPVAAWIAARWTTPAIPGAAPSHLDHYFNQNLNQTLGYLNQPFGAPGAAPAGDPQYPFPWLNWSYRPFNNEYELLLVPTVSSSRLLARNTLDARRYFAYVDGAVRAAGQTQDVYDGATVDQVPYPHLLNFFESGKSSAPPGTAAQFHRLLAYVGVPSRFANAQLQMRADLAGAAGGNHYFHTPFNRISRGREPGRINLNTVTSADVLFGALNMYMSPLQQNSQLNSAFWDKFVRSRRGDGLAATGSALTDMLQINTAMPSRFMRPYRTPGGASLSAPTAGGASTEPPRETEVTLMRADPDVALRPLFELDDTLLGTGGSAVNVTPDQFSMACMDYNRNPYFRYQALQKLGSVFSNHSNVFAVWITVGYFEVTPAPNGVDAGHPDGYTLGAELGSDTGNISRHRAFYIFDRSIPVGFIRGQDINQDKAVLLKRFIE